MQLGKTRWRRFAAPMALSTAAVAGMGMMVSNGVLAESLAVSGGEFKVQADKLVGTGFEQFANVDTDLSHTDGSATGTHPDTISAIGSATLYNLCQSVVQPIPSIFGGGYAVLRITAGDNSGNAANQPTASNLTVNSDELSGNATFSNMQIGRDASTLGDVPGVAGVAGGFGQQATDVTIDNLKQTAWATQAGTFQLPGLHLTVAHLGTDRAGDPGSGGECF